jgi:glycosyltransferase involved in cell wall biosynthesis
MTNKIFSILITTKNRKNELAFTLNKINNLLKNNNAECVVFDDGSTDGTYEYVKENFPSIQLERNIISKGYIFCRNKMLNDTKADYAISLDDDAHFLTEKPLEIIQKHFEQNTTCGLIALRIFWGLEEPVSKFSNEKPYRVQGFVGCAHVWRIKAWRDIPNYPEWFIFYGEEDFASYQLLKKKWNIQYLPKVLVNHRVDVKSRKNNKDYSIRLRRSLRSGWYLFFLFYPLHKIPRKMVYSIWIQFKLKVFKGDTKALQAISLALLDLLLAMPKILKNSNRLTLEEYDAYLKIADTKIYWNPEQI